MRRIQSKLHEIGTYDVFKISLSCFDHKRCVMDDEINTLAYFHKDLKNLIKKMMKVMSSRKMIKNL